MKYWSSYSISRIRLKKVFIYYLQINNYLQLINYLQMKVINAMLCKGNVAKIAWKFILHYIDTSYIHERNISLSFLCVVNQYYLPICDANMNLYNTEKQFAFTEWWVAFVPLKFHRSRFREPVIWAPIIVINRVNQFTVLSSTRRY